MGPFPVKAGLRSSVLPPRSCLGFVKAMLCDDLFGQHNANLFVVAAANPYREEEMMALFVYWDIKKM